MKKTTWFLFLLLFAFSCLDQPECFLLNNNVVGISFRVMGSGRVDTVGIRKLSANDILVAKSRDELWDFEEDANVTSIQVPLDFFKQQTTIKLTRGEVESLINLRYQVQAQYISEECGPRYILSNLDTGYVSFDSIRIVNRAPARDGSSRHIEVFRCPVTDTLSLTFYQLTLPATPVPASAVRSRPSGILMNRVDVNTGAVMYEGKSRTTIRLPVDLGASSTSYSFDLPQGQKQLTVGYTATEVLRYRMCGLQTFVTDLQILEHSFDSVSMALDANGFPKSTLTDPFETNINVYRCPPTNIVQIGFRRTPSGATTSQAVTLPVVSITNNYNGDVYYADRSVNLVQLPLNLDAGSTTFTFSFEGGRTETITVNYTTGPPSPVVFRSKCSNIRVVSGITVTNPSTSATVTAAAIVYPPTTNINLEIPE